ncbi:MAG: PAS domain S-box protein, partial [Desulfosalsimonadaceae bacterium]|nr:PAS domain S-box protein [Desulfosalsimonadaceae bacterium]
SPSIKRHTGFTREELIGQSILKLYHDPEDRKKLLETLLKKGEVIDYELQLRSKDNRLIYVSLNAHILYDDAGKPIGGEGSVRDITERRQVKEKLRESEEKYRGLIDNIAIGVALISPDMEILTLNNQMKQWFPQIDSSKRPVCYRVYNDPPREGVCSYCPTIKTLQDGEVHESVTDTPVGDQILHYRILSSPIKDHAGKVVAAIEMVEDITERKRTEEHIRNLSHQILNAQEEERQMISRELHDSVAQDLSTLKIALEMLFDKESLPPLATRQKLSDLSRILDRSISSVRNLSYDLRPPGLKEFGILQAISTYCEEFSEITGITVAFQPAGLKKARMGAFIEINLYRLIQEGLNNVRKHAEADQVVIKLVGAYPDIIVRVEDNGKGFDMQAREHQLDSERRMGLRSMKERVKLLQGQMTVQSRPLKGTRIFIKFPFKEDKNDSEKTNPHH